MHGARLGEGSRSVGIGSTAEPSGALAAVSLPALPGEGTQERSEGPELSVGSGPRSSFCSEGSAAALWSLRARWCLSKNRQRIREELLAEKTLQLF